jgi:CIC family chloride channel protein
LGVLAGLAALFFTKFFYKIEDAFDALRAPTYIKPMLGGLLLGILGLLLFLYSGHYHVFGVGYGSMMPVMESDSPLFNGGHLALVGMELALFLLLLMFLKMVATSLTLGSGASGGVFAPSLWMGAMLGGAFGLIVNEAFPSIAAPYGAYALVGMAAFFSGASRATLTAIIILFEMTSTYEIILPLMFACVVSDAVSTVLSKDTIYTMKIRRKGVVYSYEREVNILETISVGDVMVKDVKCITNDQTLGDVADEILKTGYQGFPCLDEHKRLCGVVTHRDVRDAFRKGVDESTPILEIETQGPLVVTYESETLEAAMEKMAASGFGHMPVVSRDDETKLVGFLTRKDIIMVYKRKAKEREDEWK